MSVIDGKRMKKDIIFRERPIFAQHFSIRQQVLWLSIAPFDRPVVPDV